MVGLQHAVDGADLEPLLLELVKMRASQINGWNRLAISMRTPVGSYVSLHHQKGT
jgi:alkylhydroperoxidase family enzyme